LGGRRHPVWQGASGEGINGVRPEEFEYAKVGFRPVVIAGVSREYTKRKMPV